MSEKDKSLPKPPSTPFGIKKRFEQPGDESMLISDKLAMAMAEGKLEEYIKEEMSDNEQARKLTMMMMSMTGMAEMMPHDLAPAAMKDSEEKPAAESSDAGSESKNNRQPPDDLVKAALDGDVKGLMDMLRREHEKINPGAADSVSAVLDTGRVAAPAVEKEVVEALAGIADENSLTMDWLILRALKLYVQEYKKTGRL